MDRLLKTAVLMALGIFLYTRITSEVILFYINDRFVLLTLLASVGFILVAASYVRQFLPGGKQDDAHTHEQHAHDHDDDHAQHDHEQHTHAQHDHAQHDHAHSLTWVGLLIVALPVLLGVLVAPRPLGAAAVGNREVNIGGLSAAPVGSDRRVDIATGERNIIDWLVAFQQTDDLASFNGQEANVVGFVYRDGRFADDSFMVGRFIVSCCVADANPVGLIVQWPDAPDLADDQWVQVNGRFQIGTFDGQQMPILIIDTIEQIEPPAQPYLYG